MSLTPVYVSGFGCITPLGLNAKETYNNIRNDHSNCAHMAEWEQIEGLKTKIASLVPEYSVKKVIPRTIRRTMSPMSEMLCLSVMEALDQAGLEKSDLKDKKVAIIAGSTTGSPIFYGKMLKNFYETSSTTGQLSTNVFKCLSSSVAINLAAFLEFKGPVISPTSACSTSAQAILLGQELINSGAYDIVIAGGSDECNELSAMSFDAAYAASHSFNDTPAKASRPFDKDRDGIVVAEGASVVILESKDSLESRGVKPKGTIWGGSYSTDSSHMSNPKSDGISTNIRDALLKSKISSDQITLINAHATSTIAGDFAEAEGVFRALGEKPIHSYKGHLGHTFAACGGIEVIMSLLSLDEGVATPTLNMQEVDDSMPPLHYLKEPMKLSENSIILSNNFAFGGMNTTIILGR